MHHSWGSTACKPHKLAVSSKLSQPVTAAARDLAQCGRAASAAAVWPADYAVATPSAAAAAAAAQVAAAEAVIRPVSGRLALPARPGCVPFLEQSNMKLHHV